MVVNFADIGGIPNDNSKDTEIQNGELLNLTLHNLEPGNTLVIEGDFHLMGGIVSNQLEDVTIQLDGKLIFSSNLQQWPRGSPDPSVTIHRTVLECIHFIEPRNITLTSSLGASGGILDGKGQAWWGIPLLGYLARVEDRPRLIRMTKGKDILLENWLLLNSPYWTTYFDQMDGLEIRYSSISARRTELEGHNLLDLSAFNTDGFDVSGRNVWIHDCNVWCQDDIIAVKDGKNVSENMLFERINGTGLGLTIGSIGDYSYVRNITFRDSYLHKTVKGIYFKFRKSLETAVQDVLVENIIMDEPEQWPIWIGPAQQTDSRNLCLANPCSICWPFLPGARCNGQPQSAYHNITLRDITINNPKGGTGVLLADDTFPMTDVTFDNVRVVLDGKLHAQNVKEAFPMLPNVHPSTDNYVILFIVGILAIIMSLGIFLTVKIVKKCSIKCIRQWCGKSTSTITYTVIILEIIFVPLVSWLVHVSLSVSNSSSYYTCKGIVNGVAIGDTWPVPSCFDDHTSLDHSSQNHSHSPMNPNVGVAITLIIFIIAGISVVLAAHYMRVLHNQAYYEPLKEQDENTEEDGDDTSPSPLFSPGTTVDSSSDSLEQKNDD